MTLTWTIAKQALAHPARVAVIDDQRTYTYAQVLGAACFIAEKLDAVTPAPHVGILLPTGGLFPAALLGAWLAHRVAVPLNYLLAPPELAHVIQDSRIDTIITVGPLVEILGGRQAIPDGIAVIRLDTLDFTGLPPFRWPPLASGGDLACLLYTSGTSGKPKGVMLTHGNLAFDVAACVEHAQITQADVFLGVIPQFHSFGFTALTLLPLAVGARVVYSARFVPKKIVELIRTHRPEIVMAVPSMYGALLSVKDARPDDFSSIRFPISGGEPLPREVFDQFLHRFHLRLLEGFGLTETSPATHWSTAGNWRLGAVGKGLPGVVTLVVDERNRPLPPNREGEVLLAGPMIMKGYYRLPELTAQVFVDLETPDSRGRPQARRFFRTGDIGKLDADGYLYITGRKKEMLIIAGENVFPREIEEVLARHPAVRDAAVVGKPDGLRGEVPIAYVELHPGSSADPADLRAFCRDKLAQFKIPREIHFVPALPRSPTGKILRRELKS